METAEEEEEEGDGVNYFRYGERYGIEPYEVLFWILFWLVLVQTVN